VSSYDLSLAEVMLSLLLRAGGHPARAFIFLICALVCVGGTSIDGSLGFLNVARGLLRSQQAPADSQCRSGVRSCERKVAICSYGTRKQATWMSMRSDSDGSADAQSEPKQDKVASSRFSKRQEYQDAALGGLIKPGQRIPDDWMPGDQFAFSDGYEFTIGEIAVLELNDGNLCFVKVVSVSEPSGAWDATGEVRYVVEGPAKPFGPKNQVLAPSKLGKILPLSLPEIQRLGAIFLQSNNNKVKGQPSIFSLLRSIMDVEKQAPRDSLPFQPILSRRSEPDSRSSSAQDAATEEGRGYWGELDGWWKDETGGVETFEVLLRKPMGMEVKEVQGEGVFVSSLGEKSNAKLAGIRVGDRISVPGSHPLMNWLDDLSSIMSAISSENPQIRLRYSRTTSMLEERGRGEASLAGNLMSSKLTATNSSTGREFEVTIKKPAGMTVTLVEGKGIFVEDVTPNGNAMRAGLVVGDRIKVASELRYEAGVKFDRGSSYSDALNNVANPNELEELVELMSDSSAPLGSVKISVVRSQEGQKIMEKFRAQKRIGNVDTRLSEKVKGTLLDSLAPFIDGSERDSVAPSKVLKINLDLMSYAARRALQRKEFDKSEDLYRKCLQMDAYDGRAWVGLAKLYEEKNQMFKAKEILQSGLQKLPRSPFLLQALGCIEQKQGQVVEALKLFQRAVEEDETHAASWVSLGKLEERMKRSWRARQCYAKAASVEPNSFYAWQCLAVLEAREGNLRAARSLFQKCTDVNPMNAASWQAWGTMERRAGNLDKAAELLQKGLKASPKNTFVLQALANIECERGNTEKAIELLERAIEINPKDGGVYQAYAMLLARSGKRMQAREMFKRGCSEAKKHAALWQAWAVHELERKNVKEARSIFQQGVWEAGSDKKIFVLWQAWGLMEASEGNLDEARKYFARAVDVADRPSPSLAAWAKVEEEAGNLIESRELLEKALAIEPSNEYAWDGLQAFVKRVYGEGSEEAKEVYQRRIVAQISKRIDSEDALSKAVDNNYQQDSKQTEETVVLRARWASRRRRDQDADGYSSNFLVPRQL